MPKEFALVARCTTIQKALRKTAAELTEEERGNIFTFLDIIGFEKHRLADSPHFHLLGRYMLFDYETNPEAEKASNNVELLHELLGYFAEGRADLPANLLPQFELYLKGWEHLAKSYESIAARIEKHHAILTA